MTRPPRDPARRPPLDPARGAEAARKLKALGVKGVLVRAAELGYITQVTCGMPECFCPEELGGARYFEPVTASTTDWMPTHEHFPRAKREGGHRRPDNAVLAHRLCNRIDYSICAGRSYAKDLERVRRAREAATSLSILETAIYASDLDAAERFYRDVLGLRFDSTAVGRHVFFRCGDAMLLVFDPAATAASAGDLPGHGAHGPGHVAFAVGAGALEGWLGRLEEHGVEIEASVDWPGGGRSIYFRDPGGNSVELTTAGIWGIGMDQ